jgi:lauroyl/myristoyl acyltransferase
MPGHGDDPIRVTVSDLSSRGALIECTDSHVKPVAIAIACRESVAEMPVRVIGRRDRGAILELRLAFGDMTPADREALDRILAEVRMTFIAAQEDLVWRVDDPQYYRAMFEGSDGAIARMLRRRSA